MVHTLYMKYYQYLFVHSKVNMKFNIQMYVIVGSLLFLDVDDVLSKNKKQTVCVSNYLKENMTRLFLVKTRHVHKT